MIPRHPGDAQGTPGVQFRRVSARNGQKRTRQEKRNYFTCAGARVSARFRRAAHICRLGADLCRPFSPRVLRSEFSDSRGWISLGLACTFPVSTSRFVKPRARWSGKRSRQRRRQRLLLPGRDSFQSAVTHRPSARARLSEMTSCGRDALPAHCHDKALRRLFQYTAHHADLFPDMPCMKRVYRDK